MRIVGHGERKPFNAGSPNWDQVLCATEFMCISGQMARNSAADNQHYLSAEDAKATFKKG